LKALVAKRYRMLMPVYVFDIMITSHIPALQGTGQKNYMEGGALVLFLAKIILSDWS
jgi:hypothetical protein